MSGPPYIASYGFLGYAKEVTLGTPVAAAFYVPYSDVDVDKDPGLIDIKLARQQRELTAYLMPGEQKTTGKIAFSLFSIMGMSLVIGAIGYDQYVTGSTPANANTLNGATLVGATTVTLTSATGYTIGAYIQIDTGASKKAEVRKITNVATNTLTLDSALIYAHADLAVTNTVVAPFTHAIAQQNAVQSFTLEENLGGLSSVQYAGCVPNKLTIKGTTKTEAQVEMDFVIQSDIAPFTATTPTYSADQPFVLAGTTLSLFGTPDASVESFQHDLDNMIDPRYTYSGKRYPTYFPSKGRQCDVKVTESLQALTYYNDLPSDTATSSPTSGANTITLNSGTDQIVLTWPQQAIRSLKQPMKVGETIIQDIGFRSWLGNLTSSMSATVISQQWAPY